MMIKSRVTGIMLVALVVGVSSVALAVNIAPLSNGGTLHYVTNTNNSYPNSAIKLSQTNLVDGDTVTNACRIYDHSQAGDPGVGFQRNFYQDVVITNISLHKSDHAENSYEKRITIDCRTDNGWTNVFDGTSIYVNELEVDLSSDPITANSVMVVGWNASSKALYFRELEVEGPAITAVTSLTNIASLATITGSRSPDASLTDGDPTTGDTVGFGSGWTQLEWSDKQRIDEIVTNIEGYYSTYYGKINKLEYLDTDDTTWVEYTDGYEFVGSHGGSSHHVRDTLWDSGKNFDVPLITKGIKFTTSGTASQYHDMFEIYVYQKLIPPSGTLIMVK